MNIACILQAQLEQIDYNLVLGINVEFWLHMLIEQKRLFQTNTKGVEKSVMSD